MWHIATRNVQFEGTTYRTAALCCCFISCIFRASFRKKVGFPVAEYICTASNRSQQGPHQGQPQVKPFATFSGCGLDSSEYGAAGSGGKAAGASCGGAGESQGARRETCGAAGRPCDSRQGYVSGVALPPLSHPACMRWRACMRLGVCYAPSCLQHIFSSAHARWGHKVGRTHPYFILPGFLRNIVHSASLRQIALVSRRATLWVSTRLAGFPPVQFRQQSRDRPHTPMFQKMERSFKERQQARVRIEPVLRSSSICHGAHVA